MRIAAHGFISDARVSSAGASCSLLANLLELGHDVHFYGFPRFTEPKSLEVYPRYRYVPMRIPWIQASSRYTRRLGWRYPRAVVSVVAHAGYQREALRLMERATPGYDFVLTVDTLNLWPSRLPVLSWPQSPPQTEWAALRTGNIARTLIQAEGLGYYAAVQAFYAYRWLNARRALCFSDLIFSSSRWAYAHWRAFGLPEQCIELLPYPIDLANFEDVPPPPAGPPTFLWLGRAVPRKRLDLFLAAFDRVRERYPDARAHVVGNMDTQPAAQKLLDARRSDPGLRHTSGVPREEVPGLFASSHVLVQPSESENFGFAVAEALAAGRPVVTGPTNGTGEYGGEAGYRFDRYDPEDVSAAMERALCATLTEPERVAAAARRAAREHFDAKRTAERVLSAAERVIAQRA
jgi:glycosyltransferase involved in cell wall biosynthesis